MNVSVLFVIVLNFTSDLRHTDAARRFHSCPVPGGKNGVCVPPNLCALPAYMVYFNMYIRHRRPRNVCRLRNRWETPKICCLTPIFSLHQDPDTPNDSDLPDIPYEPSVTNVPPETTRPPFPTYPDIIQEPDKEDLSLGDKIIEQKCAEYSQIAANVESQPDISSGGELLFKPALVGGLPSLAKEFPHMAILGFGTEDNIAWMCGGSLISDRFILTAAHCVYTASAGDVTFARLGDLNIKSTTDDAQPQQYRIVQRFTHPDYTSVSQYNDIGLVQLESPVKFTKYVRPACIQIDDDRSIPPIATGWGTTEYGGDTSDVLQKVDLVYYSYEQCAKTFGPQLKLDKGVDQNSQLCAGGSEGQQKDTCQGDSGGPLQILTSNNPRMYKLVGVTSFGKACGIANTPAVYTKVSYFSPWIDDIVWPNGR